MIFITQCLGWFVIAFYVRVVPVMRMVDYLSCLQRHANRLKCSDGAANYPVSSGSEPQCWKNTHNGFVSDWMGLLRVMFTPAVAPTMFGMEHCPAHSCHTRAIFLFLIRMLSVPLEPQNKMQPNTTLLGIHRNSGKKILI